MFLTAELRTVDGKSLGVIVLAEKQFRSGSVGFFGQTKVSIDGVRFQTQCQLVEIGSKAKGDSGAVEGEA